MSSMLRILVSVNSEMKAIFADRLRHDHMSCIVLETCHHATRTTERKVQVGLPLLPRAVFHQESAQINDSVGATSTRVHMNLREFTKFGKENLLRQYHVYVRLLRDCICSLVGSKDRWR